jgi:hypothetical protein
MLYQHSIILAQTRLEELFVFWLVFQRQLFGLAQVNCWFIVWCTEVAMARNRGIKYIPLLISSQSHRTEPQDMSNDGQVKLRTEITRTNFCNGRETSRMSSAREDSKAKHDKASSI